MWRLKLICSVKTLMRHFNSLYSSALFIQANLASLASRAKDLSDSVPKSWAAKKCIAPTANKYLTAVFRNNLL